MSKQIKKVTSKPNKKAISKPNKKVITKPNKKVISKPKEIEKNNDIILNEMENIEHNDKNRLNELHHEYMKMVDTKMDHINKKIVWCPKSLIFNGVFGFGGKENNQINFEQGVTSLSGPVAIGKTTIINIILYSLFNKLLTNVTNLDILNVNESSGKIILVIEHGSIKYTITKIIQRQEKKDDDKIQYNPVLIKTSLTFEENGILEIKSGVDALNKLKELFGDIDTFHKYNISNIKNQNDDFFALNEFNKIKYIKETFNFEYIDKLITLNTKNIKSSIKDIEQKSTQRDIYEKELSELINKNNRDETMIEKCKNKLLIINNEISDFQTKNKLFYNYHELIKLTERTIINKELTKIANTMNEILDETQKYKISMNYDMTPTLNIGAIVDTTPIKINFMSLFQNSVLTLAFKIAIAKHSNINKSELFIIDENIELFDEINFTNSLPKLMKFISNEYKYVLLASQKDTSFVSTNKIKIEKEKYKEFNISRIK
jgi:DNA repair exonuclease SbcCD ATPase subunit